MKRFVISCLVAVVCVLFVSSCGSPDPEAVKAGQELCDCWKKSTEDFDKAMCVLGIAEYTEKGDNFLNGLMKTLKKECPDMYKYIDEASKGK